MLVKEYMSVRRKAGSVVWFYDNVSKAFVTDNGSNNFIAGNDNVTRKIIKCLVGGK